LRIVSESPGRPRKALSSREITTTRDGDTASVAVSQINGIAAEVTRFVDRLEPHKTFFVNLKSTGGTAQVVIRFFSDGYLGDELPVATLAKLVDLELALAIECFADPQS
jgi:hypothetical protein